MNHLGIKMRLSLSDKFRDTSKVRGIQKFGSILVQELQDRFGVEIVTGKSDIHLNVIQGQCKVGSKNVVRLDGVYYDIGRLKMNEPIKSTLRKTDGVIYQSKWAKIFVEGMLGVAPKKSAVIYNGARTSLYTAAQPEKHHFEKVMLCCSHWRANKRLKNIVLSFIECRRKTKMNLGLFVVGKPDFSYSDPNVIFFGSVKSNIYSLYASADYMCHICHLDACPNSVVEGLCSGMPVVCNNIGGTPELVGTDGVIAELDDSFDFKPVASMRAVSKVNESILTQAMIQLVSQEWQVIRPDLDIARSAAGYYGFFQELLES